MTTVGQQGLKPGALGSLFLLMVLLHRAGPGSHRVASLLLPLHDIVFVERVFII